MKTKKRLLLLAIPVLVLSLGPWVIPVFRPWSAINCRHEEINIKTGQARHSRYLWFIKVSERVEDTILSKALGGESVDASDIEPWHKVNTLSPGHSHSPHYRFHGALFQVWTLERILERLPPNVERDRGIAAEILRLWQTTGDDEGASSYLYRVSKADSWTNGKWGMGLVPLPPVPTTLPGRTADERATAERYCQALELYQLLSQQNGDYYALWEQRRKGLLTEPQQQALRRIEALVRTVRMWSREMPDLPLGDEDHDRIVETIAALYRDVDTNPRLRADLMDARQCDTIEIFFYKGDRCRVVYTLYKQPLEESRSRVWICTCSSMRANGSFSTGAAGCLEYCRADVPYPFITATSWRVWGDCCWWAALKAAAWAAFCFLNSSLPSTISLRARDLVRASLRKRTARVP